MKNILIIGARGFGRTVYEYLEDISQLDHDINIKGFLDDNPAALNGYDGFAPIISSVEDYCISPDDFFVCAVGDITYKQLYVNKILKKGGSFYTLIHPRAEVSKRAIIGNGTIVAPLAAVGTNAVIGDFCLLQGLSVIAHDVSVGDWSRIDTHVVCAGKSQIGSCVTIFTGAIINQNAIVEDYCHVGAGSFVLKKARKGTTVYGNPAQEL